ncbi:MAG: YkgJ family cysteine cluster protein [Deltaproteobacteria bacterium]|nr:YkgJ family cysteine cluster protein [Deltaproteobacteria bacterium]
MEKKESIFLTIEQALEAVCIDFRQYDPQVLLFCEIMRVISRGEIIARRDKKNSGVLISQANSREMRWMGGNGLADHLCDLLHTADLSPKQLSSICSRVFHTLAFPEADSETGRMGIRIETGMEDYRCRQCGQCCQSLDYHSAVTEEDVEKWQRAGRNDILERVGRFKTCDHGTAYRIWMIPGTRQLAKRCPFLYKEPSENRWICRIHDAKPDICRQYPVTRKHALMTGCPGFGKKK